MKPFRAAVLQTAPISHSGTSPCVEASPRGESNPLTYRLQVGCAAIAPLGQKAGYSGKEPVPAFKQKDIICKTERLSQDFTAGYQQTGTKLKMKKKRATGEFFYHGISMRRKASAIKNSSPSAAADALALIRSSRWKKSSSTWLLWHLMASIFWLKVPVMSDL